MLTSYFMTRVDVGAVLRSQLGHITLESEDKQSSRASSFSITTMEQLSWIPSGFFQMSLDYSSIDLSVRRLEKIQADYDTRGCEINILGRENQNCP